MQPGILVLGMHRSGTSALAGALQMLDVELGPELMPANPAENEKGFFEHLGIHRLHQRLLLDQRRAWHDLRRFRPEEILGPSTEPHRRELREMLVRDFGQAPLWAVKDPLLCRLLPLWLETLEELQCRPAFVIIYRHPREVADSLARRDAFSAEKSAFLWLDHNLESERQTRGRPRAFVDYGSLLEDPVACLEAIAGKLGLEWPRPPAAAAGDLTGFLEPRLRHHRAPEGGEEFAPGRLGGAAGDLYRALSSADLGDGAGQREFFDRAERSFQASFRALDPLLLEQGASGLDREQWAELRRVLAERTAWLRRHEEWLNALAERVEAAAQDDLSEQLGRVGEALSRIDGELQGLQAALSRLESEWGGRLEAQARLLGADLGARTEVLGTRLDDLGTRVGDLGTRVGDLDTGVGDLGTRVGDLGTRVGDLDTGVGDLDTRVGDLGTRVGDLDTRTDDLGTRLDETIAPLRAAQRDADETSRWQGESLVALRRDLDAAIAAQRQEAAALGGRLDNAYASLKSSVSLAEMMWDSRPWRAYVWLVRAGRAVARRLSWVGRLPRPGRRARDPAARSPAKTPLGGSREATGGTPETRPEPPGNGRSRALIIDHRLPTPDQDSGSLRMSNLISVLQDLGFRVSFLPHNLFAMEPYATRLRERRVEVLTGSEVSSITAHLDGRGAEYDLVIVCRVPVARNCIDDVRARCPRAKLVFDTVDLQHLRKERQAKMEGNLALMEEARRVKEQELSVARRSDLTWVVSPYEQRLLAQAAPDIRTEVVSNIHVIHGCKAGFAERRDVMFIGGFEHPPNVDAAEWLVGEILPLVHRQLPAMRLYLIGSKPTSRIRRLASERVEVTGYVPDVEPFFSRCRLSVAPLRYGAGVKGKVNQSMAYGLPCVLTDVAGEGMELAHGVDAMIANDGREFAECILAVYRDRDLWQRLSAGGLENIRTHFSLEVARAAVVRSLRTLGHQRAHGQATSAV